MFFTAVLEEGYNRSNRRTSFKSEVFYFLNMCCAVDLIYANVTSNSSGVELSYFYWIFQTCTSDVLNIPVCIFLLSEPLSVKSGWAGRAGCWRSRSCLRLRSHWSSLSFVARACVPAPPKKRGGEGLESVFSARQTLPQETAAGVRQLNVCERKRHLGWLDWLTVMKLSIGDFYSTMKMRQTQ